MTDDLDTRLAQSEAARKRALSAAARLSRTVDDLRARLAEARNGWHAYRDAFDATDRAQKSLALHRIFDADEKGGAE